MYLPAETDRQDIIDRLAKIDALTLFVVARRYADALVCPQIASAIIVTSGTDITIGTSEDRHDLAALNEPLARTAVSRANGSIYC